MQLSDDQSRYVLVLNPGDISSALGSISSPQRADPLRLSYPSRVEEKMNVEIFDDWSHETKVYTNMNKFFRIEDATSVKYWQVMFNVSYEALQKTV